MPPFPSFEQDGNQACEFNPFANLPAKDRADLRSRKTASRPKLRLVALSGFSVVGRLHALHPAGHTPE